MLQLLLGPLMFLTVRRESWSSRRASEYGDKEVGGAGGREGGKEGEVFVVMITVLCSPCLRSFLCKMLMLYQG